MGARGGLRALVSVALVGCGAVEAGDPGGGDPAGEARFVGAWFVEETEPHALYGASTYLLDADGGVELIWNAEAGEGPQGHVRSPDAAGVCRFGASWRAPAADLLVIEGDCSDGIARDIELAFANPAARNATGATVEIAAVGDEAGWLPPAWGWSFVRCPTDASCHHDEHP